VLTWRGLAGPLRQKSPRWIPAIAATALLCANIITIGADFADMSDAARMLTGVNSRFFTVIFGAGITFAIVKFRYDQIALVLKWLTLALPSYIIAAFVGICSTVTRRRNTIPRLNAVIMAKIKLAFIEPSGYINFVRPSRLNGRVTQLKL
jgi:Mn2+/Fe2+ NRAMP family transporter